jgi:FkbM family methyltransferase
MSPKEILDAMCRKKVKASYEEHEESLARVYQNIIRDGEASSRWGVTVVDVGANCGLHTKRMAASIGSSSKCVCFEPIPHLFKALQKTYERDARVEVHHRALGSKAGKDVLFAHDGNLALSSISHPQKGSHPIEIEVSTLDEFMLDNVCYLKIDVEGHEAKVMDGANETISLFKPTMSVEIILETEKLWDKSREMDYEVWSTIGLRVESIEDIRRCQSVNLIDFIWVHQSKSEMATNWFDESREFIARKYS